MPLTRAPFGGYVTPTFMGNNDLPRITLLLTQLKNVIPNPDADPGIAVTYAPDFDRIPPATAKKLRAEIDAVQQALNGAPTASIGT